MKYSCFVVASHILQVCGEQCKIARNSDPTSSYRRQNRNAHIITYLVLARVENGKVWSGGAVSHKSHEFVLEGRIDRT